MAKIKLVVSATIEETFSDFIISRKTKGLAEKTLQSYQSQFQAVARHMDVKMDIAMLQKADLDAMIISMRDASLSPNSRLRNCGLRRSPGKPPPYPSPPGLGVGRRMVMEECAPCYSMPIAPSKAMSLEDMLKQADAGFTETLLKLIDKSGKKDSEIYKKALLSKQHFSKIRNNPNYKPTKPTAIALALALELDLDATKDLIGRAGYALTNSSKFDLIIRYFIEHGKYNLVEINCMLFEHDQSLLGS